jgi:Spx/MgsR family transcriptional regulator
MTRKKILFFQKPSCSTCRKAKAYLEAEGAEIMLRDLDTERLSEDELDRMIGNRDYQEFLNFRNELYRQRNMKEHPPSRAEAIRLMAETPNLIRRPVVIRGSEVILGYDEEAYDRLLK